MELLVKVTDERLKGILTTHTVTEFLENALGVAVTPSLLYQGEPFIYPKEVSRHLRTGTIVQRDIRIELPRDEIRAIATFFLARSWIALDDLDEEFRKLLRAGEMTIGQIIRQRRLAVEYQNLSYREVQSAGLAASFGVEGSHRYIRRSRMICHDKRPLIVIHEFAPL